MIHRVIQAAMWTLVGGHAATAFADDMLWGHTTNMSPGRYQFMDIEAHVLLLIPVVALADLTAMGMMRTRRRRSLMVGPLVALGYFALVALGSQV